MTVWPYPATSLALLRSQVNKTWPKRVTYSDGWIGDEAHAATKSDHNPDPETGIVHALDITAHSKELVDAVLAATVGDPRVAYVIYNHKIWLPRHGWIRYRGTNPHTTHVHISINHSPTAEHDVRPWKGLKVATPMVSPVKGAVSSEYGRRWGFFHAGIDIATSGQARPVYAAFAGIVTHAVSNRVHGIIGNRGKPAVAPGRTGNGLRIKNPDGEQQVYIHVRPIVRNGQYVAAGQQIGVVDLSGNTTGHHLHFETWNKAGYHCNPRGYFQWHGIKPGEQPRVRTAPAAQPAAPSSKEHIKRIQRILRNAGYYKGRIDGIDGPLTVKGVKAYQKVQNQYGRANLEVDGKWGQLTEYWYYWTTEAQKALNKLRNVKVRVDGDYARIFADTVRAVQSRYRLYPDGLIGPKMVDWLNGQNIAMKPRPKFSWK